MGIYIQLGQGVDFGIVDSDHLDCPDDLVIKRETFEFGNREITQLPLGPATKKRIEDLQKYLEQLKIHCED